MVVPPWIGAPPPTTCRHLMPEPSRRLDTRFLALGIAVGVALGVALDNLALWLGVGVALGLALGRVRRRPD
jgi:predicted cobalt transporter CbtA